MSDCIRLVPMTDEMYHEYFKEYEQDLDLYLDKSLYTPYSYNHEKVNDYIKRQRGLYRKTFAVMNGEVMVGEVILKNIVPGKSATLGIAMRNSSCKDKGYGTRAELLVAEYVFNELDIPVLLADSIISNTRSQHVLEKTGFVLMGEDENFRHYKKERK